MIRTVILGVGNSASAFVQGIAYYKNLEKTNQQTAENGLWHPLVGNYKISDIELVGAYEIEKNKLGGIDLHESIFSPSNKLEKFVDLDSSGITVEPGLLSDASMNENLQSSIEWSKDKGFDPFLEDDFRNSLKNKNPDVVINLISSGLHKSSEKYAEIACSVGSNFINASPTSIATNPQFVKIFNDKKLIVIGDDLMSQFGGTAFHKGIMNLMHERGIRINKSYQLDVGGGIETNNTVDEDLRALKRNVKSNTIESELPYDVQTVSGTTDFVDFMGNSRTNYFWIEGDSFLGSKVRFDIYLRSTDGPNAGGLLLDLVRGIQYSHDLKESGTVDELSNFGFKSTITKNDLRQSYKNFSQKYIL